MIRLAVASGQLDAANFASPPDSAKPWVFWFWLDGNVTREGITADLEAMERVGIGGVIMMEVDRGTPPGPVRFGSPEWREMFKFAVSEAGRLGMKLNMSNDAGWCGSGGPWITPDLAMQKLVWTEKNVSGPAVFTGKLDQPESYKGFYRDICVLAFPAMDAGSTQSLSDSTVLTSTGLIRHIEQKNLSTPKRNLNAAAEFAEVPAGVQIPKEKVLNLTDSVSSGGMLTWQVPQGNWTILRLGHTATGKDNHPAPEGGRGLECDKLSTAAVTTHFNALIGKLATDTGDAAGKAFISTHIDSWEILSQNWTPQFRDDFRRLRGYDPLPFLPALTGRVVGSLELSERFLWDFRRTVSDLLVNNYAGRMAQLAHDRGLQLSIEAYGGSLPCNEMEYAARADEPIGEFWTWEKWHYWSSCTEMASAAHTYGKPVIGAEAFTARNGERWMHYPGLVKELGDWAFCEGINRFVIHRYAMQPWTDPVRYPGMMMGPYGLHHDRTQTYWEQTKPWHEYLARCQYVLQQGLFVADICYLNREGSPTRFSTPKNLDANAYVRPGYNCDGCSAEALITRAKATDGLLTFPDGMNYRVLVLPDSETMTPELLKKISELAGAGVTVIGKRPQKSPGLSNYPACDAEIRQVAASLWDSGKVITDKSPEQVLRERGIPPDFQCDLPVRYIHRKVGSDDVYFVANSYEHPVEALCFFRMQDRQPELWWPQSGEREQIATYRDHDGTTEIPLHLEAAQSVFVVFHQSPSRLDAVVQALQNGREVLFTTQTMPVINVRSAVYGLIGNPKHTHDVTEFVRDRVRAGVRCLNASTANFGKDPAFGKLKTLLVDYEADGQDQEQSALDGDIIRFDIPEQTSEPLHLRYDQNGRLEVTAAVAGEYELITKSGQRHSLVVSPTPSPIAFDHPWTVHFQKDRGAPESIVMPQLKPLNDMDDFGVKHFSGIAVYETDFEVPQQWISKDQRLILDLGDVQVAADVSVNGRKVATLWKTPFAADVTDFVNPGSNSLTVSVANLWINRMIGDQYLPEDSERRPSGELESWPDWIKEGKPSPTGRITFSTWNLWSKSDELRPSGLIGPVSLVPLRNMEISAGRN
jgi:hypothetical protein